MMNVRLTGHHLRRCFTGSLNSNIPQPSSAAVYRCNCIFLQLRLEKQNIKKCGKVREEEYLRSTMHNDGIKAVQGGK